MKADPEVVEVERAGLDGDLLQKMDQIQEFLSAQETMDRLTQAFSFRLQQESAVKAAVADAAASLATPRPDERFSNDLDSPPFIGTVSRAGPAPGIGIVPDRRASDGTNLDQGKPCGPARAHDLAEELDLPLMDLCNDFAAQERARSASTPCGPGRAPDLAEVLDLPLVDLCNELVAKEVRTPSMEPTTPPSADWDIAVDDISEQEPMVGTGSDSHSLVQQVRAPRLSAQLPSRGGRSGDVSGADWRLPAGGWQANSPSSPSSPSAPRVPPQSLELGPSTSLWRLKGILLGPTGADGTSTDASAPLEREASMLGDPRLLTNPFVDRLQPNRVQTYFDGRTLDGKTPQTMPLGALAANPYVQALCTHREELARNSVDLREMCCDSLASRMACQPDTLAFLDTNEEPATQADLGWGLPSAPMLEFRCGPEPCGETIENSRGELEEVVCQRHLHYDYQGHDEKASYSHVIESLRSDCESGDRAQRTHSSATPQQSEAQYFLR